MINLDASGKKPDQNQDPASDDDDDAFDGVKEVPLEGEDDVTPAAPAPVPGIQPPLSHGPPPGTTPVDAADIKQRLLAKTQGLMASTAAMSAPPAAKPGIAITGDDEHKLAKHEPAPSRDDPGASIDVPMLSISGTDYEDVITTVQQAKPIHAPSTRVATSPVYSPAPPASPDHMNAASKAIVDKIEKTVNAISEISETFVNLDKNMGTMLGLIQSRGFMSGGTAQAPAMQKPDPARSRKDKGEPANVIDGVVLPEAIAKEVRATVQGLPGKPSPASVGGGTILLPLLLSNMIMKDNDLPPLDAFERDSQEYIMLVLEKIKRYMSEQETLQYVLGKNKLPSTMSGNPSLTSMMGMLNMLVKR